MSVCAAHPAPQAVAGAEVPSDPEDLLAQPVRADPAALKALMVTRVVVVQQGRVGRKVAQDRQSPVRAVNQAPPVSTDATASPAEQVIEVPLVVMVVMETLAGTAELVIAAPAVRLVLQVGQEPTVSPAAMAREELEVPLEPTAGTAGPGPPALQAPEGLLVLQVFAALRECRVPRVMQVVQGLKEPRATPALAVPGAFLALPVPMVSLAVPAEMVQMEGMAGTVWRTPSASPWLASSSCLSTASVSVPAVILAIPTRSFPRSRPVAMLWPSVATTCTVPQLSWAPSAA